MAPHSSTLAWKIPWTEEPGRLQSMGSLRVGHDWATSLSLFTVVHWRRKWQPTQVFLPGESQGRGTWWAAFSGVAQSRTWLKWLSSSSSSSSSSVDTQSCLTLCDPMDCSPLGSSVHGILWGNNVSVFLWKRFWSSRPPDVPSPYFDSYWTTGTGGKTGVRWLDSSCWEGHCFSSKYTKRTID